MRASIFGSSNTLDFDSNEVVYIIEEGFECNTHFRNGKVFSLSWGSMQTKLQMFCRVYSYDCFCPVYINPREISTYGNFAGGVNVTFSNGEELRELSRSDFYKNVVPAIPVEKEPLDMDR